MSNRAFVYGAIVIGTLAISLDFASVDLALPALESPIRVGLESVQWVINGYVLAFAVLMVTGGRLADGLRKKEDFSHWNGDLRDRVALRRNGMERGTVITFRVLQGAGAALLWPAMIGMAVRAVGESKRDLPSGLSLGRVR